MDADNKVAEWESPLAAHAWETIDVDLSKDPVVTSFKEGMTYDVMTYAGGGGGHHIYIQDFHFEFNTNTINANTIEFVKKSISDAMNFD